MAETNTRTEKVKAIFAAYPDAKEIFMASDDRAFFTEHQCDAWAQTLVDKTVVKFEKDAPAEESELSEEEKAAAEAEAKAAAEAEAKAAAEAEAKAAAEEAEAKAAEEVVSEEQSQEAAAEASAGKKKAKK